MSFPPFPPNLPLLDPLGAPETAAIERQFLDAVQGNILKGHGRDFQRLVFFRFPDNPIAARCLARGAATFDPELRNRLWVRSALEQRNQRDLRHRALTARHQFETKAWAQSESVARTAALDTMRQLEALVDIQYFSGLLLSQAGMAALGLPPAETAGLHDSLHRGMAAGMLTSDMQASADPALWVEPYTLDYHGVFVVACDDQTQLSGTVVPALVDWCRQRGAHVWTEFIEPGCAWRDPGDPYGNGYHPPREPFGFVDGISMPRFFHEERTEPGPGSPVAWQSVDLQLEDVFVKHGPLRGGSYVALLKLEQDVEAFRNHEATLVQRLVACGIAAPLAASLAPALIMGRNREGHTPAQVLGKIAIPASPHRAGQPPRMPDWLNEFHFEDVRQGGSCPFHAHIRKSNPRAAAGGLDRESVARAQPVRRGMVFDPEGKLAAREAAGTGSWPAFGDGVGLLFLAYMANPWAQFEQWHNLWARDLRFPTEATQNMDPVLYGHSQSFAHGGMDKLPALPPVVKRLGGAYLFAPAIRWLEGLPP